MCASELARRLQLWRRGVPVRSVLCDGGFATVVGCAQLALQLLFPDNLRYVLAANPPAVRVASYQPKLPCTSRPALGCSIDGDLIAYTQRRRLLQAGATLLVDRERCVVLGVAQHR